MKHIFSLFILSIILNTTNALAGELTVLDPLNPWNSNETGNIDSAFITITPKINYAQVDMVLVYSAKETYLASLLSEIQLEVQTTFDIPENTIVIDSWLWIEEYISIAHLIDLNTATNIYESYVERTQDPSLLRYNSYNANQIDLNIYPMPSASSRKVKLSFLVPIINENTSHSVNPIVDIFSDENAYADSYCEVKVYKSAIYANPGLRTAPNTFTEDQNNSSFNQYTVDIQSITEDFRIEYGNVDVEDKYSIYQVNNDDGFYHVSHFLPIDLNNCVVGEFDKITNGNSFVYDTHTESNELISGLKIEESGRYFNDAPQAFVIEYACNNIISKDTLDLTPLVDNVAQKKWAFDHIEDLYVPQSNYYYPSAETHYEEIKETSLEYRVMSKYTAFLALPIEDTALATANGGTGGGFVDNAGGAFVSIALIQEELGFNVSYFPNPVVDEMYLKLSLFEHDMVEDINIEIIDINGQIVQQFESFNLTKERNLILNWDGNDLSGNTVSKGVYFIKIESNSKNYTFKIIKL